MKLNRFGKIVILILAFMIAFSGVLPTFEKLVFAETRNKTSLTSDQINIIHANMNLWTSNFHNVDNASLKDSPHESAVLMSPLTSNSALTYSSDGEGHLIVTANGQETIYDMKLTNVYGDDNKAYDFELAYCAPNSTGDGVYLYFNIIGEYSDGEFSRLAPKTENYSIEMIDSQGNSTSAIRNMSGIAGANAVIEEEENTLLKELEIMFSELFNNIAGLINSMVSSALLSKEQRAAKEQLTIDSLVFNQYPETQLTYFYEPDDPDLPERRSNIIWGREGKSDVSRWNILHIGSDAINGKASSGENGLYSTVNAWFNLFRSVAIIGYMIILIYMGIRIMLSSTGQDLSRYKSLFMYWVIGLVILFFYPYVMKYTIILNDTFVNVVWNSVKNTVGGIEHAEIASLEIDQNATLGNNSIPDYSKSTPFKGGSDYMTAIATSAVNYRRIALSLAYLIMTWQLITLIVHYYKRVFMVGFLITIFPLVALSYAIDKIADGKSQAFNTWNKEYILNVFIQTFHAIVYALVCGTVYAGGAENMQNYDFVLIIVGVTFLFTGEEIIKKIFAQSSPAGTVKSLGETAAVTFAKVKVVQGAISAIGRPFIGKNSIVNRVRTGINDNKAANMKLAMFDRFAEPITPPDVGLRLPGYQEELNKINHDPNLDEAAKREAKAHLRMLANAVADLNNPNSRSLAELAKAYELVQKERRLNPNNAVLKDLVYSDMELETMASTEHAVASLMANGITNPVVIDREIKVRLGIDVDGDTPATMAQERQAQVLKAHMAIYGADRGFTEEKTKAEVSQYVDEIRNMQDSFKNTNARNVTVEQRKNATRWIENAQKDLGDNTTEGEKAFVKGRVIFEHRGGAEFTTEQKLDALDEMVKNHDASAKTRAMYAEIPEGLLDVTRHAYAKRVLAMGNIEDEFQLGVVGEKSDERRAIEEEVARNIHPGATKEEWQLAMSIAMVENREKGIYTKRDQLNALHNIQDLGGTSERAREMIARFQENNDLDINLAIQVVEDMSADKSVQAISTEAREKAANIAASYENGHERDSYFDDEFAIHEVIAKMDDREALEDLVERTHTARRKANQVERKLTRDVAQALLASEGIDINEGGIDTETRYFMEQTREDVEAEVHNARENTVRRILTGNTHGTPGGKPGAYQDDTLRGMFRGIFNRREDPYSKNYKGKSYEENREAFRKHFFGDQNHNNSDHS